MNYQASKGTVFRKIKRWLCFLVVFICLGYHLAHGERYAVSVPKANVRSGPGKQYDWIWQVEKYYPVQVLKKSGSWYLFRDFEGDEGWIHKSLLRKMSTVITRKKKCNSRAGPGTKYPIEFTVGEGIPFKVIERKGNWFHIEHADGDKGWIHKSLVW
ncbi:MAG: SH3 domain-containing protein [Deltaproteobacteria bacterium]|nr:SH3 domain-containing protein [Deltaproteobacteria bacterium]